MCPQIEEESIRVASSREIGLLRQPNVLAQFGESALKFDDLGKILEQACSLAREALGSDLAKVMESHRGGSGSGVRVASAK
jgi:hypothetical protein